MATVTQPKKFSHEETQRRVKHPLAQVRSYIRKYIILEGIALTLLAATGLFWLGMIADFGLFKFDFDIIGVHGIDWILEFNEIDTSGFSSLGCRIIALTVIVVGLAALGFTRVVMRWLREFNDRAVALVLERRFPKELGDRLITAVELADPKLAVKYGYSQVMVEKTILEAVDVLKKLPVASVFNWKRLMLLWVGVIGSTVGLLIVVMAAMCVGSVFTGKPMSPLGFSYGFYDTAAIWTERNVFMMDTYWPRRSHLEIGRFQPSKMDPNDMRVPSAKEDRKDLQVRAYEWVIADRKAPHGWRPLKWSDLPRFVDPSLLDAVKIDKDFPFWQMDTDELEPNLATALFGTDAETKFSDEIRNHLAQPAVKEKIDARGAKATLDEWLDWTQWSVDKVGLQTTNEAVLERGEFAMRNPSVERPALFASTIGLAGFHGSLAAVPIYPGRNVERVDFSPVEAVFKKLAEVVEYPSMSRTIRRLEVPKTVEVNFVGERASKNRTHKKEPGNKFSVSLESLADSVHFKFRARGENYFTPPKMVSLVPAPIPAGISIDKEEPAYIYHRLRGIDQTPLQGVKHVTKDLALSLTGDTNTITVAHGAKLVVHVLMDDTPVAWGGITVNRAPAGLTATMVQASSPFDAAGLKADDVLVKLDGEDVPKGVPELAELLKKRDPRKPVELTVSRKVVEENKPLTWENVTLKPATVPAKVDYDPRPLRPERAVFPMPSPNPETGSDRFNGTVAIDADRFGFSLIMDKVERNHDFLVEFYDEDNIRGKRRFKVVRTLDAEPLMGNLNVFGYTPRKPRFKAATPGEKKDEKDKDKVAGGRDQAELVQSYLITPDALLPLECKVADDYGLVKVGYVYKYRKVDFELIATGGAKQLPVLQVDKGKQRYYVELATSNFQFWPGNPLSYSLAPNYIGWTGDTVLRDLRIYQGYKDGFIPAQRFEADMRDRAGQISPTAFAEYKAGKKIPDIEKVLRGIRAPRGEDFDFKPSGGAAAIMTGNYEGFDLQRYLSELKARPLDDVGQLHYQLQIAVQATDNNVETGVDFVQEIDVVNDNGVKSKQFLSLRGNTKKNGNGYLSFIVVSENELLAQIALEEEILNDKLEGAKDKVDAGMTSLLEQQSKIGAPNADIESIFNRMNEISQALGTSKNVLEEAHQAYDNILKEMKVNRVDPARIQKIDENIIVRLEQIVNPDPRFLGSLPRAIDALAKARDLVEKEYNGKLPPNVDQHRVNMTEAHRQMAGLSRDIQKLLDAMSEGITNNKLIALLVTIEQIQRDNTRILEIHRKEIIDRLLRDILEGKDKKKDPPKEEKKTSRLQDRQLDETTQAPVARAAYRVTRLEAPADWRNRRWLANFNL